MHILTSEVHPVAPNHFGQKYFGTDWSSPQTKPVMRKTGKLQTWVWFCLCARLWWQNDLLSQLWSLMNFWELVTNSFSSILSRWNMLDVGFWVVYIYSITHSEGFFVTLAVYTTVCTSLTDLRIIWYALHWNKDWFRRE